MDRSKKQLGTSTSKLDSRSIHCRSQFAVDDGINQDCRRRPVWRYIDVCTIRNRAYQSNRNKLLASFPWFMCLTPQSQDQSNSNAHLIILPSPLRNSSFPPILFSSLLLKLPLQLPPQLHFFLHLSYLQLLPVLLHSKAPFTLLSPSSSCDFERILQPWLTSPKLSRADRARALRFLYLSPPMTPRIKLQVTLANGLYGQQDPNCYNLPEQS